MVGARFPRPNFNKIDNTEYYQLWIYKLYATLIVILLKTILGRGDLTPTLSYIVYSY
jgi:hypothetical protein